MPSDKTVRKLFKAAETDQKTRDVSRHRGSKKLGVRPESTDQQFCDKCYALLTPAGGCPNCREHAKEYTVFCKRCLCVHPNTTTNCAAWQPKQGVQ